MKSTIPPGLRPATRCIHAGHRAHAAERGVVLPLVRSATFQLDDESYRHMVEGTLDRAVIYTRIGNPTVDLVQRKIAALEGAERSLLFASGMAAIHAAVLSSAKSGQRILCQRACYGSTWDLFANFLPELGIEAEFADLSDARQRAAALERRPALVWCESLSNPTLEVADLPAIARDAHAAGVPVAVDATFASPILQRPLELGADLVVHSATKYLAGHSDLIAGVVSGTGPRMQRVYRWLQIAGGCLDPETAFLLDRGLKTLALRVRAQVENAARLAAWLGAHPRVERVIHPGRDDHPQRALAASVLDGPGAMLAFVVRGGDEAALAFLRRVRVAIEASSLGGVETLVSLPFNTSHARLSAPERARAGIGPGFVRVSVGIEDAEDLIADFDQALGQEAAARR